MSLIDTIKKDQVAARKVKNVCVASILTTLIGEAESIGKNNGNRQPTDDEVLKLTEKFVKNNKDTISLIKDDNKIKLLSDENFILSKYLPSQFSSSELKVKIEEITLSLGELNPKMMGKILGELKKNFSGQYDGAEAASIVKSILEQ